jgi:cysteine desulfurase
MSVNPDSIYLDVNADAAVHPAAWTAYVDASRRFANPSSSHQAGRQARECLEVARQGLAGALGAQPEELVFTSGGTEADGLALFGAVSTFAGPGKPHVLCSALEHAAVLQSAHRLEARGEICLEVIPVGRSGVVSVSSIVERLRPTTALVSVVLACNETGVVQPVGEIGAALAGHGALLHSDAVQALGRISVDFRDLGVDMLSVSAHKVGGLAGAGALVVREGTRLGPILIGGGQEQGRRASTPNIAGAAAFAAAVSELTPWSPTIRDDFEQELEQALGALDIVGRDHGRLPNTSCVRFEGCEGDGIMMALDIQGIGVSTGSACSTGSIEPSRILLAMGLSEPEARSCVRFSFPRELPDAQRASVVSALRDIVLQIRTP